MGIVNVKEEFNLDDFDSAIDPATEGKQDEIIAALSAVEGTPIYETLIDDTTTADFTYIGKSVAGTAESAASWQIKAIDETGAYMKMKFADNVSSFTKIWDNRVSYTYT